MVCVRLKARLKHLDKLLSFAESRVYVTVIFGSLRKYTVEKRNHADGVEANYGIYVWYTHTSHRAVTWVKAILYGRVYSMNLKNGKEKGYYHLKGRTLCSS